MVSEEEIAELFKTLRLGSKEDRTKILSQGVVLPEEGTKDVLCIAIDNVTKPEEISEANARLEPTPE